MRDDGRPRSRLRSLISGAETVDRRTTCQGGAGRVGRARGRDAMRFDAVHASVAARRAIISCMSNATTTARSHHARHTGRPSVLVSVSRRHRSLCQRVKTNSRKRACVPFLDATRLSIVDIQCCPWSISLSRYPCCLVPPVESLRVYALIASPIPGHYVQISVKNLTV